MKRKTFILILIYFISLISYAQVNLEQGLVAYYPFTNGSVDDFSNNGNNATNNGATTTFDRFGNYNSAYNFDGSDDYINTNIIDIFTNKISMALWFKTSGTHYPSGLLTSRIGYSNFSGLSAYAGPIAFHVKYSGALITNNGVNYLDNGWHFCVGTYDGSMMKIYMDGVYICSNPKTGDVDDLANYLIGFDESNNNRHFNGDIDDIRIYNRALSELEIQSLYTGIENEMSV